MDRAADLRWKSGIRLRGTGGGTEDFKRSGLRLFYCGGAAVRVMADTFVCKGEKSILSEEIYIRLGTAWGNGRFRCTTPEELKAEPETFLCVPAKEIARIITLKTSGSTGAPKRLFFTEDDLMQTADFFETGMQYMVKPGDRVTVYMEGPGFFSIGGLLKEGLGRIQVETKVHGLIRDMEAAARDGEGADCLIGVPSQMSLHTGE